MNSTPKAFSGTRAEEVYLKYFAAGDLETTWHGRRVRIAMGTTHPAQLKLVEDAFGKYAKPIVYPAKKSDVYCWRIVCDLDKSFTFLFSKLDGLTIEELNQDDLFYAALSGFTDSDGHIGMSGHGEKTYGKFQLYNTNEMILREFQEGLGKRGIGTGLYRLSRPVWKVYWTLAVRARDVLALLPRLSLRHAEKLVARDIMLQNCWEPWHVAGEVYKTFRAEIIEDRSRFIEEARQAYSNRNDKKERRMNALKAQLLEAHNLQVMGSAKTEISRRLQRSERTIYRWLRWYRIREGYGTNQPEKA